MYSVKQKANSNLAYMVELYNDESAYQAHRQSPQYAKFAEQLQQTLTDHKVKFDLVPQFIGDKKIVQTPDIKTNFVSVTVKPEHASEFKQIVMEEMEQSVKVENGVLAIYAANDAKQSNKWYFFEVYANEAAFQSHRNTPHFQRYLKEAGGMLADRTLYDITPSELGNKGGVNFYP